MVVENVRWRYCSSTGLKSTRTFEIALPSYSFSALLEVQRWKVWGSPLQSKPCIQSCPYTFMRFSGDLFVIWREKEVDTVNDGFILIL